MQTSPFFGVPVLGLVLAGLTLGAEIRDIHWKLGPDFPHYRKGAVLGVVQGQIISSCGMEHPWCEAASTFALPSLGAAAWQPLPDCPTGRAYVRGVALENSLYVVGGRHRGAAIAKVDKLTKKDGTWLWSSLPHLNQGRTGAAVAAVGSKLYVVGGTNWGGGDSLDSFSSVESLDTSASNPSWTNVTRIPGARGWCSVAGVNGKLYVFGGVEWASHKDRGVNYRRQLDEVKVYDPVANAWQDLPPLPFVCHASDCVVYDNRYVIIVGGACLQYPHSRGLRERKAAIPGHENYYNPFVVVYDTQEPGARLLPSPLLYPTADICAALVGNTLVVVGGENIDRGTSNTTKWVRSGTIEISAPSTAVPPGRPDHGAACAR